MKLILLSMLLLVLLVPSVSATMCGNYYADITFDNYLDDTAMELDWIIESRGNSDIYLNNTQGFGGSKALMIEGRKANATWENISCFSSFEVFFRNETQSGDFKADFDVYLYNSSGDRIFTSYIFDVWSPIPQDYVFRHYAFNCSNLQSPTTWVDVVLDSSGWMGIKYTRNDDNTMNVYAYTNGSWITVIENTCTLCAEPNDCNISSISIGSLVSHHNGFLDDFKLNHVPGELTDCTRGEPVLEFTIKAEEDPPDLITADLDIDFSTWYDNPDDITYYNFTLSGSDTYQICMYPNGTTLYADAMLEYNEDINYTARQYYLVNTTLSSSAHDSINLYLLNETLSDLITIYVQSPEGIKQDDVIIKAQRLYIGENTYRTVVMGKTNFDGHDSIYMRMNDIFYRFILEKDGKILRVFNPFKITSTDHTLTTATDGYGQWFSYINNFGWYCNHNDATNTTSCTYSDTSGKSQEVCLLVKRRDLFNYTTVCDICETSTSGTLYCEMGDTDDKIYTYSLRVVFDEVDYDKVDYILEQGWLDFTSSTKWGIIGVLVALMLFIICVFMGIKSPASSIALGVVALFISTMFGFIDIAIGSVLGLAVVAAIIIYRMRS